MTEHNTENNIVSDSRFNMWRAVFSVAHVDGQVSAEEVDFAKGYLDNAPFSEEQKRVLREDLQVPQDVAAMLAGVTDLSDQADFFQFAHMMAWKDGNYAETEQKLLERIQAGHLEGIDVADLRRKMRAARQAAVLRRAAEDEGFTVQAEAVSGFANVIRFVAPWVEMRKFEAPPADMFHLWRAVFSLVHADGELAEEEKGYIEGMMDVFRFSEEQQSVIRRDMEDAPDTLKLFQVLNSKVFRKQFFIMARTIVWCDGFLHEKEMDVIDRIKADLGAGMADYISELRWIDRRPDAVTMNDWETGEEVMMKSVVRQMLDFYHYAQKQQGSAA